MNPNKKLKLDDESNEYRFVTNEDSETDSDCSSRLDSTSAAEETITTPAVQHQRAAHPLSRGGVENRVRDILIHWNPKQPDPQPASGIHTLTGERIKRPPNAYLIFAKQRRRELRMDGRQGTRMQEITSYMSLEWRQMTPQEKEPYFQVQKRLQQEHMAKYPGYVYTPAYLRKNGKNKSKQVNKQIDSER